MDKSVKWYYVLDGKKTGPVEIHEIRDLYRNKKLGLEDHIWCAGMENWQKIKDSSEVIQNPSKREKFNLHAVKEKQPFFIRVGGDRNNQTSKDYGPYQFSVLKKLFQEKRINEKTLIYTRGMEQWESLSDIPGAQSFFKLEIKPQEKLQEKQGEEKRINLRKPFIARIFFSSQNELLEGICSDLSLGGMKVLMEHFPGSPGVKIKVNVHPDDSSYHFTTSGEVVRVLEGRRGFSFQFDELSEEARKSIENYIQKK